MIGLPDIKARVARLDALTRAIRKEIVVIGEGEKDDSAPPLLAGEGAGERGR